MLRCFLWLNTVTLFIPKGERNGEYKVCLKEIFENVYSTNVAGVFVPDDIIKEMAEVKKEDRKKKAVEVTARIIRAIKPFCQGVHLMPLGWDEIVPDIIENAGL